MVWIFLKLFLAIILSSIPFIVKYYAIPKGGKDSKWANLFSLIGSKLPWLQRRISELMKSIFGLVKKMSVSKKHRQFYVFILILTLVLIQIVNNKASMEVAAIIKAATYHENFELLRDHYIKILNGRFIILLGIKWFMQLPTTNLAMLIMTIILFRKKLANKWLEAIRDKKNIQFAFLLIMLATLFAPTSDGFLISEIMFVIMLFASFYPAFDNEKSRRYYAIKQIRLIRNQSAI